MASCYFDNLSESLIRDRIVCGVRVDSVVARLLRETYSTFMEAVYVTKTVEISVSQLEEIGDEKANKIHHVRSTSAQKKIQDKVQVYVTCK